MDNEIKNFCPYLGSVQQTQDKTNQYIYFSMNIIDCQAFKNISGNAVKLYLCMIKYAKINKDLFGDGTFCFSISRVMKIIDVSVKTAVKSVKELVYNGFIERVNDSKSSRETSQFRLSSAWENVSTIQETQTINGKELDIGYIYLVKMGENYKIGKTKKPKERLVEFTKMPQKIETVVCEKVKGYSDEEKFLHTIFSHKNIRGEWYSLDKNDIENIKTYLDCIKLN